MSRRCGAGAVATFPRVGPIGRLCLCSEPRYSDNWTAAASEAPRGILTRVMRKLSKIVTPAALESLPRLVAALCNSAYLHEIVEAMDEAHYQRQLRRHERWAAGYMERTGWLIPPPLYPEEWEHWCFEIPHTIS